MLLKTINNKRNESSSFAKLVIIGSIPAQNVANNDSLRHAIIYVFVI
jgi:hypothetical protein